jgi:tetratricopeptide (TPR) repeat protein
MSPTRVFTCLTLIGLLAGCSEKAADIPAYLNTELVYAGGASCAKCHEAESELWRGSHHDLAMQEVTAESVLGDFDDATFSHDGVDSTFTRQGDEFRVRTQGPDGELQDYRIAYVFGVYPLQQYLVEFPGGRYQVLQLCWDTRTQEEGGQRWFHLYPDEHIPPGDPLHWTGINQNWNYMCAECHSTDLRKGYDAASRTYETTWEEINVSCESCHGPASRHIAWADAVEAGEADPDGPDGLQLQLKDEDNPAWVFDQGGIARRQPARSSQTQIETCARCHSRRAVIAETYTPGKPLVDTHRLSLLEPHLYHPDGQILDEVYVYGSFLQSRMHAEGVTCSDCHDPHSLELWNPGNAACAKCHLPARYDSKDHHRHKVNDVGGQCVECHMRDELYMVVDARHDHSFRVPRPDLSLELGTPNACSDCHQDSTPEWAAEHFTAWWPERAAQPHYGQILARGREGGISSARDLGELIADSSQPGIVRATAIDLLASQPATDAIATIDGASRSSDPLVRASAAAALDTLPQESAARIGASLLSDPVRAVRIAAARPMAQLPAEIVEPEIAPAIAGAIEELRATQRVNADRPEAHLTLGSLHAQAGEFEAALAEYREALELDPESIEARINLADLYRQQGNENQAENALREALALRPDNAATHYALGLALVRQSRTSEAISALEQAATFDPDNPRYGYVLAVAIHSTGRIPRAIALLKNLNQRWPENPDFLVALATYHAQMGGLAEAEQYARRLVELDPGNPQSQAFLQQVQASRRNPGE